jgi:phosphosulfolactate synthase
MSLNYTLEDIPERTAKPRKSGITMVMDKGICLREAEDMLSGSGPYIDIVKLGFGSSYVTPNLEKKINIYRSADIPVYFGGTLFEAFVIRNNFDGYLRLL